MHACSVKLVCEFMYCMYLCMYICMYVCMYVYEIILDSSGVRDSIVNQLLAKIDGVCMYVYVCMYVCMYVHVYI